MDFIFGLAPDSQARTGILVFVDRFSKMTHLVPVHAKITAAETAAHFIDAVFRHHGLPENIVSDRDPRFTSAFWTSLFELLGTKLLMSTAAHPETDGQTERVNRVLEDVLRSYATSFTSWSAFLPLAEFALNNAVHASTGRKTATLTPPDVASPLARWTAQTLIDPSSGKRSPTANYAPIESARPIDDMAVSEFILQRQAITRFVRDALQSAVDQQKENADKHGRKNMSKFEKGDRVLLSTEGLRDSAVTNLGASKLAPRFIGPFKVLKAIGDAYTLDVPSSLRLHPTFYVGRLKEYRPATLHGLAPMPASGVRKSNGLPVVLDAPMTWGAASIPSEHDQAPGAPEPLSVRAAHGSTAGSHSQSSPPGQHVHWQPQPPAEHRQLCSRPDQHRPGQPGRQHYHREGPPPLVDAEGQVRWIVDRIVGHEDPPQPALQSAHEKRAVPSVRRYRVRWLGFPPEQDTWEPRSSLLRDVPDVVLSYEATKSGYSNAGEHANALVTNESGKEIHVVENENDDANENDAVNENVVVNTYYHDCEARIAQQDGQANVSLPCADYSAEIDSAVASGAASEAHHE
ncbi:unnamed protein product [Peronospora farinosa]|uniref:Integrase catalytic domain-containing protein n=1 Tax=Peronospora farinosa TaxID=134698 RepID=A0ABN8C899_9STRA|nr:unnamed protein product [Peronospora farinosa]